jgi:hypothetical protein
MRRLSHESKQQFVCTGERDGASSDKVAPNPVMVTNDADGVEVGAVIQRMAISNHDDVMMVCHR